MRQFLVDDHVHLNDLLGRAMADPRAIDLRAYEEFRAGLLRHIAMEEKILLPEARRRRNGERLPIARRLRADHAALASLLVPTPTHAILATLAQLLEEHNPLEEGDGGVYDVCERLVGEDADALLARIRAVPPVRVSAHVDEPRIHAHIAELLRARSLLT